MRVCTVREMREMDRRAAEDYGLPAEILMENAGQAVYHVLRLEYGLEGRRFAVVCGRGNNCGDGLVVARLLHSSGADVRVYLLSEEDALTGPSRSNLEAVTRAGIPAQRLHSAQDLYLGRPCDLVVDAIFGTGLTRDVGGLERDVVERINASGSPVVCVDIPSGVDGDTGAIHGVAIRGESTVTFGLPKLGTMLPPGRELCGRLFLSRISLPPALYAGDGDVVLSRLVALRPRALESHKGSYGDVLFVAGAASYLGAPVLSSLSFLKAGGGYARLATPRSIAPVLAVSAREVVFVPLEETRTGAVALSNLKALSDRAAKSDLVVVGPGLSLDDETQELVRRLVSTVEVPVLIDGDGLTAVSQDARALRGRTAPTMLTPHAGELSRLLGTTADAVTSDRVGQIREAAAELSAFVLLKGSSTLVCAPDGEVSINLSGNPGMATAGCGDVLTGVIAALIGLDLGPRPALEVGAFIHGLAGDYAAQDLGQDGITASDIMERLPRAMREYRGRFRDMERNFYGKVIVI